MIALLLALQTATMPVPARPTPPAPPQRIDLLACRSATGDEIVVCGERQPIDWGPSSLPQPSNPDVTGIGALAAAQPVCAARMGGCQVGVDILGMGTAAIRLVGKLIDPDSCCDRPGQATSTGMLFGDAIEGIGKAFRKTPPKAQRIAIDLDTPPPPPTGRLSP